MSSEPQARSPFKNPLLYTSALTVIALLYVGYTFNSRRQETKALEQKAAAQQREEDRKTVERLGGSNFDILLFYASPSILHRGESALLCYGVSAAKIVTLDPPVHPVRPTTNSCFDISPQRTTTYTLTATDASGHSKSQSVEVRIR